jgi:hypothetical protein
VAVTLAWVIVGEAVVTVGGDTAVLAVASTVGDEAAISAGDPVANGATAAVGAATDVLIGVVFAPGAQPASKRMASATASWLGRLVNGS